MFRTKLVVAIHRRRYSPSPLKGTGNIQNLRPDYTFGSSRVKFPSDVINRATSPNRHTGMWQLRVINAGQQISDELPRSRLFSSRCGRSLIDWCDLIDITLTTDWLTMVTDRAHR